MGILFWKESWRESSSGVVMISPLCKVIVLEADRMAVRDSHLRRWKLGQNNPATERAVVEEVMWIARQRHQVN